MQLLRCDSGVRQHSTGHMELTKVSESRRTCHVELLKVVRQHEIIVQVGVENCIWTSAQKRPLDG